MLSCMLCIFYHNKKNALRQNFKKETEGASKSVRQPLKPSLPLNRHRTTGKVLTL